MFKIVSITHKLMSVLEITDPNNQEHKIEFVLSSLISRRNRIDITDDNQMVLLNAYLDYKGLEYKTKLFDIMLNSFKILQDYIMEQDLSRLPILAIHNILDYINIEDICNYIEYDYMLSPPDILKKEYSYDLEEDGKGSRIQTYLIKDYYELISLAVVMKILLGPLAHFYYIKQNSIVSIHKEYILLHFIKTHNILEYPAIHKILGLIERLILQNNTTDDISNIRILEKQISKPELPYYILAVILIQKISLSTIVDDNNNNNIITNIYNYINNKLKSTADTSKSIRNKFANLDNDTDGGEQSSYLENYKLFTQLNKGNEVEFNFATSSIEMIMKQLPVKQLEVIDRQVVNDAYIFYQKLLGHRLDYLHIKIISCIFKSIIDPRALSYLNINNVINLYSVAFAYLYGLGYKELALLLCTRVDNIYQDTINITSNINKSRLAPEIKTKLYELFPYEKIINKDTSINIAEEEINNISVRLMNQTLIPLADDNYIESILGSKNFSSIYYKDIRTMLANFIIQNEELIYNSNN